jgi:outer membrane immunogenic protein
VEVIMRKNIQNRLLASVAAVALLGVGAAQAADLPRGGPVYQPMAPMPVSTWQGLYIGGHVGYQWGDVANSPFDPRGFAGGLQLGYDWQFDRWVIGAVTDIQLTGADDSAALGTFSERWFGTTRARLGYSYGNVLPYLTGGIAYGGLKLATPGSTESKTHFGWTVGAGIEAKLTGGWSVFGEYLYMNLGDKTYALTGADHDYDSSVVKLGVNYRF